MAAAMRKVMSPHVRKVFIMTLSTFCARRSSFFVSQRLVSEDGHFGPGFEGAAMAGESEENCQCGKK